MRAIVLGVHVRPVSEIPAGQGGQLVEEIRMTAAGTAGGTAVTLAKLGAEVHSAGAIGSDALGDALVGLLSRGGVKTSLLVRREGVQTSADLLAPGDQAAAIRDWIAPAFPYLDYLLPNDEQVLGLTGAADLADGCRQLITAGAGCVAATRGADGALVVTASETLAVRALATDVVDTTGCGDAFSAGFLRGRALGGDLAGAAALGCATAAFVAGGLGSDHGDFDLRAAEALSATIDTVTPTRRP